MLQKLIDMFYYLHRVWLQPMSGYKRCLVKTCVWLQAARGYNPCLVPKLV